jgi:hypothetical protein
MARIGKITIFVDQSRNQQTISVRTTGSRGAVNLSGITADVTANSQSPTTTPVAFWQDVLSRASTAI